MKRLSLLIALMLCVSTAFAISPNPIKGSNLLNFAPTQNNQINVNSTKQVDVTLTAQLPSGETLTVEDSGILQNIINLDGQHFRAPGKESESWVRIPIYVHAPGFDGTFHWYGPGDETVGESGLYDFLMEILRNL